jgi:hypothetical protein
MGRLCAGRSPTLSPEDVDETGGFLADVIEANRYVETGQKTGNVDSDRQPRPHDLSWPSPLLLLLEVDPRLVARFDEGAGQWLVAGGIHRVAVSASASIDDAALAVDVELARRLFGS